MHGSVAATRTRGTAPRTKLCFANSTLPIPRKMLRLPLFLVRLAKRDRIKHTKEADLRPSRANLSLARSNFIYLGSKLVG